MNPENDYDYTEEFNDEEVVEELESYDIKDYTEGMCDFND